MVIFLQVEIPVELYNFFAKKAEFQNCTVEEIVRQTIKTFLERSE